MPTKTTDRNRSRLATGTTSVPGPIFANTAAYWLEDDLGNRITKLYSTSDKPLMFAGRALENVGSLDGWTVARRDDAGARHVVATGVDLEQMATPFMPSRTAAEARALKRHLDAVRAMGFRRANVITDKRVY